MGKTNGSRFIFSAYANSAGAIAHQPLKAFLSDTPCAALPVTGGLISQARENIDFRIGSAQILRIGRASSTVLGEFRDDHYVSLATSTVEKLNILDVVTADAVVSRVTSVYPANRQNDVDTDIHPARFYVAGSHFDNLKIDGKVIQGDAESRFNPEDGFAVTRNEAGREFLFTHPCREIFIPQFGTIHLGEVDIYSAKIILTMLRVELGCPVVATVTAGNTSTNGRDG
jgi:hypothetical protein